MIAWVCGMLVGLMIRRALTAFPWLPVSAGGSESPTLRIVRGGRFAGRAAARSCDRDRGALRSRGAGDLA
jgi:hypothetical protein